MLCPDLLQRICLLTRPLKWSRSNEHLCWPYDMIFTALGRISDNYIRRSYFPILNDICIINTSKLSSTCKVQMNGNINIVHHRSITSAGVSFIDCRRGDGELSLVVPSVDGSRRIILSNVHPRHLIALIEICCPTRYFTGQNNIACRLTFLQNHICWSHTWIGIIKLASVDLKSIQIILAD